VKAYLLFTVTGPVLVLSKFESIEHPELLNRLSGFGKFIAHEVSLEAVKSCYAMHYQHVLEDIRQTDELRILDQDGQRIFTNIDFRDLGVPVYHQPGEGVRCYYPLEQQK